MLKPGEVAKKVEEKINRVFQVHHHTQAWKMYNIRKPGKEPNECNVKYCHFDKPHGDYIYTQEWVDFLVQKLSDEAEYHKLCSFRPNK